MPALSPTVSVSVWRAIFFFDAARCLRRGVTSLFLLAYPPSSSQLQMESGVIAKWLVKPGSVVKPGDALAEVETDKATVTFEAMDDAVVAAIVKEAGSTAKVGEEVAVFVDSADAVAAFASYKPAAAAAAAPAAAAPAPAAPKPAAAPVAAPATPVAAPKPAAPAPAPVAVPAPAAAPAPASADTPYVAFENWGAGLKRSPMAATVLKAQSAYASAFGFTGFGEEPAPAAPAKEGKEAKGGKQ